MPDDRDSISRDLLQFTTSPLREASLSLLKTLGYESDKTIALEGSKPKAFLNLLAQSNPDAAFDQNKALFADWTKADLLFQLSDEELAGERSLFKETEVKPGLFKSYLFFAIELNGNSALNGTYARGKLTAIARQLNRVFPMPVMLLIKHPEQKTEVLSIAVINRRANKREQHKDVLGKVTIIRDISLTEPHRGHLDILDSFAVPNLVHPAKLSIRSFDTLHAAWEEIFNVELLNKRFYEELANWYFWALPQVEFPADLEPDDEKRRATGLIRLLTRLIFCWFIKEKGLIPEKLFHRTDLDAILKDFDPDSEDSSQFYQAILQNLFFATLNQRMGKNNKGEAHRQFALDEGFQKNRATHDVNNYYRYEAEFQGTTDDALRHFADVPFLNGGLFECLDRRDEEEKKTHYLDGFSRNAKKRPYVPNHLFFSDEIKGVDLSDVYHDKKRKRESVSGLLRILSRYKFTIVENTPIDQEIALDPELLGKVFENLLASYNEETKTTARKQTGSFYTPRPIVDYMVDESLKAHLAQALADQTSMSREDAETGLAILFAYTEREHAFSEKEIDVLLDAIHTCKILDPACGSGAFPMGVLHKLVYILTKLDPGNQRWQARQIDAAQAIPDFNAREAAISAIEKDFAENEDDYGRKLYLIENCLYGVDIQPIAIQISKLRFFISLICDQKTNKDKAKNHGIRPLPNLETKFVAADTLIGLPISSNELFIDALIEPIEKKLAAAHHAHFSASNRQQKLKIQNQIKDLRSQLANTLQGALGQNDADKAQKIAKWDAFDPQGSADFFNPHWMYGSEVAQGFDIVIGNPPYGVKFHRAYASQLKREYETYTWRGESYVLFIECGSKLIKPEGTLAYIVPDTYLNLEFTGRLRDYIRENFDIPQIYGLPAGVFESVTVDTTLLFLCGNRTGIPTTIKNLSKKGSLLSPSNPDREFQIDPAEWDSLGVFNIQSDIDEISILKKIRSHHQTLGEFAEVLSGIKAYQVGKGKPPQTPRVRDEKPFTSESKKSEQWKPFFEGKHIERYAPSTKQYGYIHHGPWLAEPRTPELFWGPKLFVRKIVSKTLISYYSEEECYCNTLLFVVKSRDSDFLSERLIQALLNSRLLGWYYKKFLQITDEDTFPQIMAGNISDFPIPTLDSATHHILSNLAQLTQLAFTTRLSSSSFLDDLTDACVMECYFREHMAERDLLFLDDLAPYLNGFAPDATETAQRAFLDQLVSTLNAPSSKIRNRLLRLTADSPDLLAVIKQEGKV